MAILVGCLAALLASGLFSGVGQARIPMPVFALFGALPDWGALRFVERSVAAGLD